MATDWDLEDWLLDAGEAAETKRVQRGDAALSPAERLVREVWLLDMEIRNGGLSQYFASRGRARWTALVAAEQGCGVPSLRPILAEIERVVAGADDPYLAALHASPAFEAFYELHQPAMLRGLRSLGAAR